MRYNGLYGDFPEKQRFLKSVGLSGDYDYCSAFISYAMIQAETASNIQIDPSIRSGRSLDFIDRQAIPVQRIITGNQHVAKGSILIWVYNQWAGHTGFSIEDWDSLQGLTIEANVSHPDKKGERGIFVKQRDITPTSYFRPRFVRHVTVTKK